MVVHGRGGRGWLERQTDLEDLPNFGEPELGDDNCAARINAHHAFVRQPLQCVAQVF